MKSIKSKLLLLLLVVSMVPLVLNASISTVASYTALYSEGVSKVEAIRNAKKGEIEEYFNEKMTDNLQLAQSLNITTALQDLEEIYPDGGISSEQYSALQTSWDKGFQSYIEQKGYYDLFLISVTGEIMYTVAKEDDLGQSLKDGALASTNFAETLTESERGTTAVVSDYAYYEPSKEPAAFIVTPVKPNGVLLGYVATQLSDDRINDVMQKGTGLGEHGESYLFGQDKKYRSDSKFSSTKNIGVTDVNESLYQAFKENTTGIIEYVNAEDGATHVSAFAPVVVGDEQWGIVTKVNKNELLAPLYKLASQQIIILVVALAVITVVSFYFAKRITTPLMTIAKAMNMVSDGDLTVRITPVGKDEIATLSHDVNSMIGSFEELIQQIQVSSTQVQLAVTDLSSSSLQSTLMSEKVSELAQESSEQSLQQSRDLRILGEAVQENTMHMNKVTKETASTKELGEESVLYSEKGQKYVEDLQEQMVRIEQTFERTLEQVYQLVQYTENIQIIVKLINEISDQTNLLSLNAAIEAARAGDAGKGFGVVAEEVRKLAAKTKESSIEISNSIQQISEGTTKTVQLSEIGKETIQEGVKVVKVVETAFSEIQHSIHAMLPRVNVVSHISKESLQALEKIVALVETTQHQMDGNVKYAKTTMDSSKEQLAAIEEITSSTQELSAIVTSLEQKSRQFKVNE